MHSIDFLPTFTRSKPMPTPRLGAMEFMGTLLRGSVDSVGATVTVQERIDASQGLLASEALPDAARRAQYLFWFASKKRHTHV